MRKRKRWLLYITPETGKQSEDSREGEEVERLAMIKIKSRNVLPIIHRHV